MTKLLWAMLRARRGIALTVTAIAAVAVAAAAAGPIYLAAAGAAARETELAGAPRAERVISRTWGLEHANLPVSARITDRREAPSIPGFDTITGLQVNGDLTGGGRATARRPVPAWLAQRSGACEQVTMVTGRCASGGWEVMISEKDARSLGTRVGGTLTFEPDRGSDYGGPDGGDSVPRGIQLSIVGVCTPKDVGSAYWADREYVTGGDAGADRVVMFATNETLAWAPYDDAREIIDLVPRPEAFANPGRLRAIAANAAEDALLDDAGVSSQIPALLDRMEASGKALAEAVALAVVPLVLLSWLVLYLAVVDSAFRRRAEAGLSGLRGVPGGTRWWLGIGEYLVPILLGAPLGLAIGYLAISGVARSLLPGDPPVTVTPLALLFALAAVVGAVGVGVVAQWRATAVPIVDLLRRIPGHRASGRLRPGELVTVALAAAATYQVSSGGQRAGGLALLTPMLVALAIGLVAARVTAPAAVLLSRRGLRRGAVGRALAGVLVARQPGHARLLSMFVVLFGLLGFAVTAADVAQRARDTRVTTEMGAPRVLTVEGLPSGRLLTAVRAADPSGRYAMAVTQLPGDGAPVLAVDSTRLARVARWSPAYGPSAAQATTVLRPTPPRPARFTGTALDLLAETAGRQPEGVRLQIRVQPESDRAAAEYSVSLRRNRKAYRVDAPACRSGCRLVGLHLSSLGMPWYDLRLTLHSLRRAGPDGAGPDAGAGHRADPGPGTEVVSAADFADPARWDWARPASGPGGVKVTRDAAGARLAYTGNSGPEGSLISVSTPRPVPLLAAPGAPPVLAVSGTAITWRRAGELRMVPGTGATGALVDLEYADLAGFLPGMGRRPRVWLAADAPGSILDRLRHEGLSVTGDQEMGAERGREGSRGPALALRFYLVVAVAAVALGLGGIAVVASTQRTALAAQLRALRAQGVPSAVTWRAGFGGHLALAALSGVVGTAAGGLAWWVARGTLPIFVDGGGPAGQVYAPDWPRPLPVALALVAALLVLTAAGAVATLGLRRAVERPVGSPAERGNR